MPMRSIALSVVALALVAVGCGRSAPTSAIPPSSPFEAGSGAAQQTFTFDLNDPTIIWYVNWYDEALAGGGWIGGARMRSRNTNLIGGVWRLTFNSQAAWDWAGYTEQEPDGIIIVDYPHQFLSQDLKANGKVNVNVRNMSTGDRGRLKGRITGGTVREVLYRGNWVLVTTIEFSIDSGQGVVTGYTGSGVSTSAYRYDTGAWLLNRIELTLNIP